MKIVIEYILIQITAEGKEEDQKGRTTKKVKTIEGNKRKRSEENKQKQTHYRLIILLYTQKENK